MKRLLVPFCWLVVVGAWVVILIHAALAARSGVYLNHVSGVWMAMAQDLSQGVFYRSVVGSHGYGGTRYFPGYFVMVAGAIRAGLSPIGASYLATGLSVLGVGTGLYTLLRRLEVKALLSVVLVSLFFAPIMVQRFVLELRGDLLAAGLNIWALAFACRLGTDKERRWDNLLGALLFTLAFATKMTSVFGIAAAFGWLFVAGRKKQAWQLFNWTIAGFFIFLALLLVVGQGAAVDSFRTCTMGGRSALATLLQSLTRTPYKISEAPYLQLVLWTALGSIVAQGKGALRELPALFFVYSGLVTMFVLGSPGTDLNHIFDVYLAGLVVLGVCVSRNEAFRKVGLVVLAMVLLSASTRCLFQLNMPPLAGAANTRKAEMRTLLEQVEFFEKPVLSESPLFPVLAKKSPYLLDPFSLRVMGQNHPQLLKELYQKLDQQDFAYVLLINDPDSPEGQRWYESVHLGQGVLERILENYRPEKQTRLALILVPKVRPNGPKKP